MIFIVVGLLVGLAAWFLFAISTNREGDEFCAISFITLFLATFLATTVSYLWHASDLGTLRAQKYVIEVQEQRITILQRQLDQVITMKPKIALVNQDAPIKSLVDQISAAVADLAGAKTKWAEAKISIEARKAGPFWFIAWLKGDQ